ncbi:hypothetical protein AK830_g3289 [Neonectria ditissima]|uniref:Dienelactone hydrolase domain-containing protein n=1 Tax=Neonectria ditissima TaxID=78410 RepID=A0A0P7BPK6_9HYPO|nr:hypothetical protein AK830_g3289 [Neonectria ditissima]
MASNQPGQCCSVGVRHDGEPTGTFIKIGNNVDAYFATPPPGKAHQHAGIVYVPDIFGIWVNSQLMADQFAANGYTCVIPDFFNGDQAPNPRPDNFDIMGWLAKGSTGDNPHTAEQIDPIVLTGIAALKDRGITKIGAVGYCLGAKFVVRNFKDNNIDVAFLAHPSFVTEEELSAITGPLSIAAAQTDTIFPLEKRIESEKILGKSSLPWQINLFSGVEHGFAVRGDVSSPVQRFAKEQAFFQAVAWFDEHLNMPPPGVSAPSRGSQNLLTTWNGPPFQLSFRGMLAVAAGHGPRSGLREPLLRQRPPLEPPPPVAPGRPTSQPRAPEYLARTPSAAVAFSLFLRPTLNLSSSIITTSNARKSTPQPIGLDYWIDIFPATKTTARDKQRRNLRHHLQSPLSACPRPRCANIRLPTGEWRLGWHDLAMAASVDSSKSLHPHSHQRPHAPLAPAAPPQPQHHHHLAASDSAPVSATSTSSTDQPPPVLTPNSTSNLTSAAPATTLLPIISSDEDHSSEDGYRSASPRRPESNSSSISDPAVEDDPEQNVDGDRHRHRRHTAGEKGKDRGTASEREGREKAEGPPSPSSRRSTVSNASIYSHAHVRRLSASEMQRLTNAPESLPVAPAPQRRSIDQESAARLADQREAIRQSMLRQTELVRQVDSFQLQPNGLAIEARAATASGPREAQRRPSPAPRTVSTPPISRALTSDGTPSAVPLTRRYSSFHSMNRPPSLHLNVDGSDGTSPTGPAHSNPASAIPGPQTEVSTTPLSHRASISAPLPPIIPLPPMSLPTHLQLELAAQRPSPLYIYQSQAYDNPYESNAVKFERLKNVLLLPPYLERTLNFGALACLDAWLYNFTILPVRFFLALGVLVRWWGYVIVKEVKFLVDFVWYGLGRLWQRGRTPRPPQSGGDQSEDERSRSDSRPRGLSTSSATSQNGSAEHRANGNTNGDTNGHFKAPGQARAPRPSVFRHKRTKSTPSNLSSFHKADLLQGSVIICSSMALMTLDASRMYHFIRAQSAIKLYVIYNILEVGDRLLSALGQDILECLFSTETLSRNASGRSKVLMPLGMFLLALAYCCLHSISLYYQVITLNVAVNSYSNALLTLLLSNQFVEIKSTVFKRFEKDNLFQLTCADIVERFQLWIMLLIIGMRNVVEVGGLSVPGAGSEPGFDETSGALPLHNPSILPHSFTVLPSWLMSGEVLSPFLIVIGSEMLVDAIKHAYVTKFNNIKPAFYSRILDILCKDYYTNAFMTPSLTRRLGLAVIPLSCLFIRASIQTYHMLLSTHLPMPLPETTQTSLSEESAVPSSPAVIAALNRFDSRIRDSLGRATYGYPYGSPLNSRPWYSWTSDDVIAAVTMIVVFFIAFLVLLIIKLLLGMVLLKYARNRFARMKHAEHLIAHGQAEFQSYETPGSKRVGGFGHVEVGEERQRWIHADKSEGLKGGKGPSSGPPKPKKPDGDMEGVSRYEMVAKRIW